MFKVITFFEQTPIWIRWKVYTVYACNMHTKCSFNRIYMSDLLTVIHVNLFTATILFTYTFTRVLMYKYRDNVWENSSTNHTQNIQISQTRLNQGHITFILSYV